MTSSASTPRRPRSGPMPEADLLPEDPHPLPPPTAWFAGDAERHLLDAPGHSPPCGAAPPPCPPAPPPPPWWPPPATAPAAAPPSAAPAAWWSSTGPPRTG